jgi:hypothetical protein
VSTSHPTASLEERKKGIEIRIEKQALYHEKAPCDQGVLHNGFITIILSLIVAAANPQL